MVRQTRYLWLGNLPGKTNENQLTDAFKKYGRIQSIKLHINKGNKYFEAVIAFLDIRSAAKAHNSKTFIDGCLINTQYSEPPNFSNPHLSQLITTPIALQQPRLERQNQVLSPSRATDVPVCTTQMTYLGALESNSSFSRGQTSCSSNSCKPNVGESKEVNNFNKDYRSSSKCVQQDIASYNQFCSPLLSPASSTTSASTDSVSRDGMHGVAFRGFSANLSDSVIKDALINQYKRFGDIISVDIIISTGSQKTAVLTFSNFDEVLSCLENSHNDKVLGQSIFTSPHKGFCFVTRRDHTIGTSENKLISRTLLIPNSNGQLNKDKIQQLFSKYGNIMDIEFQTSERNNLLIFVEMDFVCSAIDACRNLNDFVTNKIKLKVTHCKTRSHKSLLIENLNSSTSQKSLQHQLFRYSSHIDDCFYDRRSGRALVIYQAARYAQRSLQQLIGRELFGSFVKVDFAGEKHLQLFKESTSSNASRNYVNSLNHHRMSRESSNPDFQNTKSNCSSSSESILVTNSRRNSKNNLESIQSPKPSKDNIGDDDVFIVSVKSGGESKRRFCRQDDSDESSRSSSIELPRKQTLAEYFYISTANRTLSNSSVKQTDAKELNSDASLRSKYEHMVPKSDFNNKTALDTKIIPIIPTTQLPDKSKCSDNIDAIKYKNVDSNERNLKKTLTSHQKSSNEPVIKISSIKNGSLTNQQLQQQQHSSPSTIASSQKQSKQCESQKLTQQKSCKFSSGSSSSYRGLPTSPILISWITLTSSLPDPRLSQRHYGEKCKKYSTLPLTKFTRELYSQISQKKTLIDATLKELQIKNKKDNNGENSSNDLTNVEKTLDCTGELNDSELNSSKFNLKILDSDIIKTISNLNNFKYDNYKCEEYASENDILATQPESDKHKNIDSIQSKFDDDDQNLIIQISNNLSLEDSVENCNDSIKNIADVIISKDETDIKKNNLLLQDLSSDILDLNIDLKTITKTIINENCIPTNELPITIEVTICNIKDEKNVVLRDNNFDKKINLNLSADELSIIKNHTDLDFVNINPNADDLQDKSEKCTDLKSPDQTNLSNAIINKNNKELKSKVISHIPVTKSLTKLFQLPNDLTIDNDKNSNGSNCKRSPNLNVNEISQIDTNASTKSKIQSTSTYSSDQIKEKKIYKSELNKSSASQSLNKINRNFDDIQNNLSSIKLLKDAIKCEKSLSKFELHGTTKNEISINPYKPIINVKQNFYDGKSDYKKSEIQPHIDKCKSDRINIKLDKKKNYSNFKNEIKFNNNMKSMDIKSNRYNTDSHKQTNKMKSDKGEINRKKSLDDIKKIEFDDKNISERQNYEEKQKSLSGPNHLNSKDKKDKFNLIKETKDNKLIKKHSEEIKLGIKSINETDNKSNDKNFSQHKKEVRDKSDKLDNDKLNESSHKDSPAITSNIKTSKSNIEIRKPSLDEKMSKDKGESEKSKVYTDKKVDNVTPKKHLEDKRELKALLDGCTAEISTSYMSMYDMVKRRSSKETSSISTHENTASKKNRDEYSIFKNHKKVSRKKLTKHNKDNKDKNEFDDNNNDDDDDDDDDGDNDSSSEISEDSYQESSDNDASNKSENGKNYSDYHNKKFKSKLFCIKSQIGFNNDSEDSKNSTCILDLKNDENSSREDVLFNSLTNKKNSCCPSDGRSKIKAIIAAKHKKSNDMFSKIVNSIKSEVKFDSENDPDEPPILESQSQVLALLSGQSNLQNAVEVPIKRCLSNEKIESDSKRFKVGDEILDGVKFELKDVKAGNLLHGVEIQSENIIKSTRPEVEKTLKKSLTFSDFKHSSLNQLDEIILSTNTTLLPVETFSLKPYIYEFEYFDEYDLNIIEMPVVKCGPCPMPLNSIFDFKIEDILDDINNKLIAKNQEKFLTVTKSDDIFARTVNDETSTIMILESHDQLTYIDEKHASNSIQTNLIVENVTNGLQRNENADNFLYKESILGLKPNDHFIIPHSNSLSDKNKKSCIDFLKDNLISNNPTLPLDLQINLESTKKLNIVKTVNNKTDIRKNNITINRRMTRTYNKNNDSFNQISLRSGSKLPTAPNTENRFKNKRSITTKKKKVPTATLR